MRRWLAGLAAVVMLALAAKGLSAMRAKGWVRWPPSGRGLGGAFLILGSIFDPSIVDRMNAERSSARVWTADDDAGKGPPRDPNV